MFLPTTKKEMSALGWKRADIILISGDSYIDSPYMGTTVIGRVLLAAGFKTAIIAQPDVSHEHDIKRLGEPTLFWGVSGGSVDSMVANYTASGKKRRSDDFTPGGLNTKRPDRAVIRYCNLIRQHFKNTVPIVLGGIEASLRRISHFDAWSKSIRKSIVFDAKADYLVYGMGEKTVVELAKALKNRTETSDIRGLCYIAPHPKPGYTELPPHGDVADDKNDLITMFNTFYGQQEPLTAKGLYQNYGDRYLIHTPPQFALSQRELDDIHDLPYERDLHPLEKDMGIVKALDTIRFSIPTHRGCYGECRFCAIAVHQGRTVCSRSEASILREAAAMTRHPLFRGVIRDAGGPTANMFGFECRKKLSQGACSDKSCLFPKVCASLKPDHGPLIRLFKALRRIDGVKHVFTASGIRPDLVYADPKKGKNYLKEMVSHHVSGQLKIAPEHSEKDVLNLMGKPDMKTVLNFKKDFEIFSKQAGKKQFLTYYMIAGHPGCELHHMKALKDFSKKHLGILPEQVQIFTATPCTYSTLMYATEIDPFSGKKIVVERDKQRCEKQKSMISSPFQKKHRTKKKN